MWNEAYLSQARSDWEVFAMLQGSDKLPRCHALHYLQMAGEKLGKAVLLAAGNDPSRIRGSHKALVRLLQISSRNPKLGNLMGMRGAQLRSHLSSMSQVAYEIERLTPALAQGGPNVEYPWETGSVVFAPARYEFDVEMVLIQQKGRNLVKLLDLMMTRYSEVFA